MDAVIRFRQFLPDGTWRWAEHTLTVVEELEKPHESDEEDAPEEQ